MNGSEKIMKMLMSLLQGSVTTLEVFFLTLLFSLPLAAVICAGRMSKNKVLSSFIKFVLMIVRGTPLMLQIICVYFIPATLFSIKFNRFVAAIVALSINYACYFAEIYRAGFESIPHGQYEACKVLGYTNVQTFFHIICPQVIKRIVPPMGNEVMTLVKDTALVKVISVIELLSLAEKHSNALVSIVPLFIAGLFYLVMNGIVSFGFNKLERKLSYYK